MEKPGTLNVPDVQNEHDDREIALDQVGVSSLRYPITVMDRDQKEQHVTATLSMSVDLPHQFKGTHMSRFIEVLNGYRGELTMRTLPQILAELKTRLNAESAQIEVNFQYFLERKAPVTGMSGLMDYGCSFQGESNNTDNDFVLGVNVPVTSLCPCSKEISDYGAHNQRGNVDVQIRSTKDQDGIPFLIWIEEVVDLVEQSASAPLYPLLKRPDERHVTMQAYDNPVFVEDLVRNVAVKLKQDKRVAWFSVEAVNQESIHNHNAFARVQWTRPTSLL
ncbi:GTP cyclohydrolase FolE2 [Mariniblastus sp.]|nr:GTP cyclohydrolase FolE2 [Mariniblastus sp.]